MSTEQSGPVIEARLKGPGPAKYKLPGTTGYIDHDGTKRKMPAFSFGKKLSDKMENCSPGPAYMIPGFLTRVGKKTTPAYSLYGRSSQKQNHHTPAPGQYSPEKYPPPHCEQPPSYSFGVRYSDQRGDNSPAPNNYMLPSSFGVKQVQGPSSPSYSIVGRSKNGGYCDDLQQTPGPGKYRLCDPNLYLAKGPAYSIAGRHGDLSGNGIGPGPGAYYLGKVSINKKNGPSFTFGIRHTEYITMLNDKPTFAPPLGYN